MFEKELCEECTQWAGPSQTAAPAHRGDNAGCSVAARGGDPAQRGRWDDLRLSTYVYGEVARSIDRVAGQGLVAVGRMHPEACREAAVRVVHRANAPEAAAATVLVSVVDRGRDGLLHGGKCVDK